MAAFTAAGLGLRTALIEEHPAVGTPTHCTGKLQVHAFQEFALPSHLSLNALRAGVFYAPDGTAFKVRRATPDSHVVDRDAFDRWLAEAAQREGVDLVLGTRVRGAERLNGAMRVEGVRGGRTLTMSARMIIDAEGARPILPKSLGLRLTRRWVNGLQYQVANVDLEEEDCPEIYLGTDIAPGFFAWLMPLGGRRGRVGLCVDPRVTHRPPVYYIERLLRNHPVASRRLRGATIERKLAGPIPLLGSHRPSVTAGMLVVGDAAGHVKATSGGGIYFAMIAGRLAAQAAAEYLGGDRRALGRYEGAWRRRFGRELRFTAFARQMVNQLTDIELNQFLSALRDDPDVIATIEHHGDTAYQSHLLRPLLHQGFRWTFRTGPMAAVLLKALRAGAQALWEDGVIDAIRGKSRAGAESLGQTIGL
jgi:geranylgeranyl reductase family protein